MIEEQSLPRAFAYGNTPTHDIVNVAPAEITAGDVMKHLGRWHTVTQVITRRDGATAVYFRELDNGALIPLLLPEGTMAVTVLRPTRDPADNLCAMCKQPISRCVCD